MTTGFSFDSKFMQHNTGAGHPECPERVALSLHYLESLDWFKKLKQVQAAAVNQDYLQLVHSSQYLKHAESTCNSGQSYLDSPDVSICPASFDIALLATGSLLQLIDSLMKKEIDNGFAMVRPPGHHAESSMALGFCLFNNVAVAARYFQKEYGLDKILIIDWDVHHGNGTQHMFEQDPSVFYISLHQYPFYPGTGAWSETGEGKGNGYTLNCPLAAGCHDHDYEHAFITKVLPAIDNYQPEAIIISAGFDAHQDDPLGQMQLSTGFYGWMTERLLEKAHQYADGRIISALEGGYNLQQLPLCIAEHLSVLSGHNIVSSYP